MTAKFNRGKAYHGSSAVTEGKLQGATDTGYFLLLLSQLRGQANNAAA